MVKQKNKKKKFKNKPVTQFQLNRFRAGMIRELVEAKAQASAEATLYVNQTMVIALHEQGFRNVAIDKILQKQTEIGQRILDDPDYDIAAECEKIGYGTEECQNFNDAMPAACRSCFHKMVCQFRSGMEMQKDALCVHYRDHYGPDPEEQEDK